MLLSRIITVYNEAAGLSLLLQRLKPMLDGLGCDHEVVFVNDGSVDGTAEQLRDAVLRDRRIKLIELSRNFGHQVAITAGLDYAHGDAVVVMDADLQDPPELIPEMLRLYEQGYDVVSAQRVSREGDGWFKRVTATLFYGLMRAAVDGRLANEVGDFRLFSRNAMLAIRGFREQHRFMRGLVAWLGLKEVVIPFHRASRAAGETKYPLWKMLRFAWTAISSFSALPLRLTTAAGILTTLSGATYLLYALFTAFVRHAVVQGWTSLVCLQVIFSGAVLIAVGVVGDYVARIYEECKNRPLYVVSALGNIAAQDAPPRSIVSLSERVDAMQQAALGTPHENRGQWLAASRSGSR
jgi:dolichol-phosphate mannosyltransferase